MTDDLERATSFCERFGLRVPVLLSPMAGVPAPALSIAIANAGGMGACGALLMPPDDIRRWVGSVRASTRAPFQLNLWIPGAAPVRDAPHESAIRTFLADWGPSDPGSVDEIAFPNFNAQCDALIAAEPRVISSVMGVYTPAFVSRIHSRRISWFAGITTVAEARAAQAAGADVIVAQGAEAGGHRAVFDADAAERTLVGLFALLPAVVDAVTIPVVAAGGIADARGVRAAFALGASAVQVGTAFLRSPEAGINPVWANALGQIAPEDTVLTRAFTGRAARAIATDYTNAAMAVGAPLPAAYPVQRALTAPIRQAAAKDENLQRMQAWAGQSAALGRAEPAADIVARLWKPLLGSVPQE
ncbi:MAG: nitronate monooxygenase [Gemmatimonadota bacterium]|nr:nitronate monooxygenase [Gemmatimonadota bacterium]